MEFVQIAEVPTLFTYGRSNHDEEGGEGVERGQYEYTLHDQH